MHHHSVGFLAMIVVVALIATLLLGGIGLWVRRRVFAGPRPDEWDTARRGLSWADWWTVIWATARRRPVRPILLACAQLAYVRYVHDAAQRAPVVRSRGLRVMMAGIAVLVTGAYAAMAVTSKRASTAAFWAVAAAVWAVQTLYWAMVGLRARRCWSRWRG